MSLKTLNLTSEFFICFLSGFKLSSEFSALFLLSLESIQQHFRILWIKFITPKLKDILDLEQFTRSPVVSDLSGEVALVSLLKIGRQVRIKGVERVQYSTIEQVKRLDLAKVFWLQLIWALRGLPIQAKWLTTALLCNISSEALPFLLGSENSLEFLVVSL